MAVIVKSAGFASTGPTILTGGPFYSTNTVYYVNSVTGSDSNAGTLETAPKATVFGAAGALSLCTTGESNLVKCSANHAEAVAATNGALGAFSIGGVTIVSEGTGTARATFTSSVVGAMLNITGTDVMLWNLYFAASTAATTAKVTAAGSGFRIRDCQFDQGSNDAADGLLINAVANCTVRGCTFSSTGAPAGTTKVGARITGAATNLLMEDCTVDGGAYSWSSGYGVKVESSTTDRFRILNTTLSNYSFIGVTTTTARGIIGGANTFDATSGVAWTE